MSAQTYDIEIVRGKTFAQSYLYASEKVAYRPITAVVATAPYRITVTGHGVPDGWPVRIEGAKSPAELNTPGEENYLIATVIDADTIEFNGLNGSSWKAYSSGGLLVYNQPAPLIGWIARAQMRTKIGGAILFKWHTDPLTLPDALITIDGAALTLNMTADDAANLSWSKGVYEIEIEKDGEVRQMIAPSACVVIGEIVV